MNRRSIDMISVQPWDMPEVEGECIFCHDKLGKKYAIMSGVGSGLCIQCSKEYDRQAKNYMQRQANQYPRFGQEE